MGAAPRSMTGLAAALALMASSVASAASTASPAPAVQAPNAWLVLTDLSASQTAGQDCKNKNDNESKYRCKAAPVPPSWGGSGGMANGTGPIFVMGIWWGLIALALASGDNQDHANSPG